MHPQDDQRAYLITESRAIYTTSNQGTDWYRIDAPTDPNTVSATDGLKFHPTRPEWLIWHGTESCSDDDKAADCRVVAHYSKNRGSSWTKIDDYVQTCSWGRDIKFKIDETIIICHAYRDKAGNQRVGIDINNPTQLVIGRDFFKKKTVVFDSGVVGFATFEEYMVVAAVSVLCFASVHVLSASTDVGHRIISSHGYIERCRFCSSSLST